MLGVYWRYIYTKQAVDRVDLIDQVAVCQGWYGRSRSRVDEGLTERPSESKRLVLTSLPHQLQPAAWLGRNPHHCLFKATKHKLGVSEVIQGRKRKASALPVGVAPVDWWFEVPRGGRCHREFHSKRQTCHSPQPHGPAQQEGSGRDGEYSLGYFALSVFIQLHRCVSLVSYHGAFAFTSESRISSDCNKHLFSLFTVFTIN